MARSREVFVAGVLDSVDWQEISAAKRNYKDEEHGVSCSVQARIEGDYHTFRKTESGIKAYPKPLAKLEVIYSREDQSGPEKKLLEMMLKLDKKGNLVGLHNKQFTFWYHTNDGSTTYQMVYRVDKTDPTKADLHSIRTSNSDKIYHRDDLDTWFIKMFSDPTRTGMFIPKRVNWVETFNLYYSGEFYERPLTGQFITQYPLVADPNPPGVRQLPYLTPLSD